MRKLFLVTLALIGFTTSSFAQEISKNAIGLRLGDSRGFGAEISYQRAVFEKNRIELDFGWRNGKNYDGIKLTGVYQWVWNINGGFNWFAGPGVGFAAYQFDNHGGNDYRDSYVFLSGDVGIEYKFDFPLLLSLDVRPELGSRQDGNNNTNIDLDFDIGLGARYTF